MRNSGAYSKILKFLFVVYLLYAFQGCVHAPGKKATRCGSDPTPYRMTLRKLTDAYRGMSGKIKVHIETSEGNLSFPGTLYASYPDKLHLDIYGFLHRPKFFLVQRGELIAWKDFETGRRYEGPLAACPPFPVRLPFSPRFLKDLVRVFFLNFPEPLKISPLRKSEGDCYFRMVCGWGRFNLLFDPIKKLPLSLEGPLGAEDVFTIRFSHYRKGEKSLLVPWEYEISVRDVVMTISFKDLLVNPPLSEDIFLPSLPPQGA